MSAFRLVSRRYVAMAIVVLVVFNVCGCAVSQYTSAPEVINPLDYGLNEAKTGEERYRILLRTHQEAQKRGLGVSYIGIGHINVTIPDNAKSIPLTSFTDFAGVTIQVENKKKGMFLYTLSSKLTPIIVEGKDIDDRNFSSYPALKKGNKLLVIYDKNLWVQERIGYGKGTERKDIMLVRNGRGINSTVQGYRAATSMPDCYYRDVDVGTKTIIKNVTFKRTASSTEKTYLVKIENQFNVEVAGVNIRTPDGSGLYGDMAMYIVNCADVKLKDVS